MREKIRKIFASLGVSMPCLLMTARVYASSVATGNVSIAGMDAELTKTISEIIGILFWIACVACTLKIIHIGILYMTTGVEGKSKAKGAMLPWVIGVFICATFATLGPAIMDLFYTNKNVLDY